MYNTNLVVNPPGMAGVFRCKDCHMNFQSQHLLTKHKSKFCVGSTGDPDDLQLRRGFRSISPPRFSSPADRPYTDSELVNRKDDYRRPNQDHLQSLAKEHGRQMEYLQLRNKDLEKQREDILKRLEGLGRRSVVPVHDNTADLLRELREQELRNQRALDDLRKQLYDLNNNQKVNVIEIEKPVYPQPPPPAPAPPPPEPKKQFVFPVYYGKSLVAEISAIRQAYLQNGGNDPDVLAQMSQMQAEAQAIEDQMNQKPEKKSPREKPNSNMDMLKFMEMENERLNQELRLLQEQKLLGQNRGRSDKEDELEREIRRLQREHLEKMYSLQKEMDDLKLMLMMERNRPLPQPPSTVIHQSPQNPVNLKPYVEVEPMAPYDQYPNHFLPLYIPTRSNYETHLYKRAQLPEFPRSRTGDGYDQDLDPDSYKDLGAP